MMDTQYCELTILGCRANLVSLGLLRAPAGWAISDLQERRELLDVQQ
jgi:hypothetical protein